MLERIAHRGPDDRGTVQVDGSWLGHRRLSIVDVEGGAQPLRTAEGRRVPGRQRRGLQPRERARPPRGPRDPHDLRQRGRAAPARRVRPGGAAPAQRHVRLRDGHGGRALRRRARPRRDQAAVLDAAAATRRAGALRVARCTPSTPSGARWSSRSRPATRGRRRTASSASPPPCPSTSSRCRPAPTCDAGTREALIHAVERQMMGDVPVGVFLSGGLDSSLVAAIAARWAAREGTTCRPSPSARTARPT